MPEGWDPPAPAWQSTWNESLDGLVAAYFGVQSSDPSTLEQWAQSAFALEHGPKKVDQALFEDATGVVNHFYIAYWPGEQYVAWWQQDAAKQWWDSEERVNDGVGYWREVVTIPLDHLETLHSTPVAHGIGELTPEVEGPILEHGYSGGMRDRIPLSAVSDLRETSSIEQKLPADISQAGLRVRIQPPEHMCIIRSGQNWSECDDTQREYYFNELQPRLQTGMHFLRDNPRETHCFSMRYAKQTDSNWNALEQTFGLGFATDVHAFEEWAKSHPTHLSIFGGFMEMVEKFGETLVLRLWHEVNVLPAQGCEFEYIQCHSDTGLLKYV
jgi:aldoxime dehydratase